MQRKLDYTQEEVRVLKDVLKAATGSDRMVFTADQRRRLAVAGKALSPEERKKCCQIVKPGTLLGWFRQMAVINVNYFCRLAATRFAGRDQGDERTGDRGMPWVVV